MRIDSLFLLILLVVVPLPFYVSAQIGPVNQEVIKLGSVQLQGLENVNFVLKSLKRI